MSKMPLLGLLLAGLMGCSAEAAEQSPSNPTASVAEEQAGGDVDPAGEPGASDNPANQPSDDAQLPACAIGNPAVSSTVAFSEQVPGLDLSLADLLEKGLHFSFDEVKYAQYTDDANWTPDQVESVTCGAAQIDIHVAPAAEVRAVVYEKPTETCASGLHVEATITATSNDGAIQETMDGDLSLQFDREGLRVPSHIHFFAEQPLSEMQGTAKPVGESKPGSHPSAEQTFRVESRGSTESLVALLRFVSPEGEVRYADWRNECGDDSPVGPVP
jgi:hypothetical protein